MQERQGTIVVVASGEPHAAMRHRLAAIAPTRVIAADGGVDAALALGLEVSLAIGDFDSVSAAGLAAVQAAGARIERHPAEKDATDLELALDTATAFEPERILVVGSDDGRLDHLLGSLLLLGEQRYAGVEIDAFLGPATVHVIRGRRDLHGTAGEIVSLLPLHGPAVGVATEGLEYPLRRETLEPGSSRGISNAFVTPRASVSLTQGVLVALRPGTTEERSTP